jgi:hypothetical protein
MYFRLRIVDPFLGGEILVKDFTHKSREICNIANVDQPFMCIDLTFISVLLEEGYGLKPQTPIKVSDYFTQYFTVERFKPKHKS